MVRHALQCGNGHARLDNFGPESKENSELVRVMGLRQK